MENDYRNGEERSFNMWLVMLCVDIENDMELNRSLQMCFATSFLNGQVAFGVAAMRDNLRLFDKPDYSVAFSENLHFIAIRGN